jgi:hypothetical protein
MAVVTRAIAAAISVATRVESTTYESRDTSTVVVALVLLWLLCISSAGY